MLRLVLLVVIHSQLCGCTTDVFKNITVSGTFSYSSPAMAADVREVYYFNLYCPVSFTVSTKQMNPNDRLLVEDEMGPQIFTSPGKTDSFERKGQSKPPYLYVEFATANFPGMRYVVSVKQDRCAGTGGTETTGGTGGTRGTGGDDDSGSAGTALGAALLFLIPLILR